MSIPNNASEFSAIDTEYTPIGDVLPAGVQDALREAGFDDCARAGDLHTIADLRAQLAAARAWAALWKRAAKEFSHSFILQTGSGNWYDDEQPTDLGGFAEPTLGGEQRDPGASDDK